MLQVTIICVFITRNLHAIFLIYLCNLVFICNFYNLSSNLCIIFWTCIYIIVRHTIIYIIKFNSMPVVFLGWGRDCLFMKLAAIF